MIASGCCAHGTTAALAVGQLVAELTPDGRPWLGPGYRPVNASLSPEDR